MFVLPCVLSPLFIVGIGLLFSATLASAQDDSYFVGTGGGATCPAGSEPILDEDGCEAAADAPNVAAIYTDGLFRESAGYCGNESPPGCHGYQGEGNLILFNTNLESTWSGTPDHVAPICKRIPVSTAGG